MLNAMKRSTHMRGAARGRRAVGARNFEAHRRARNWASTDLAGVSALARQHERAIRPLSFVLGLWVKRSGVFRVHTASDAARRSTSTVALLLAAERFSSGGCTSRLSRGLFSSFRAVSSKHRSRRIGCSASRSCNSA
jgi:hypothetical protein